jgi:hypothetical protein
VGIWRSTAEGSTPISHHHDVSDVASIGGWSPARPCACREWAAPTTATTFASSRATASPPITGIDLALALVEDDYGTEVAQTAARWLVLYLRRPGGQTQFAAPVWMPRARRAPIRDVQEAIDAEPAGAQSILSWRAERR